MNTKYTNKLSFSLLKKISIIIISSFVLVGFGSIHRAKLYSRQNLIKASKESLNEVLYIVANVNSVLMQQMRVYTKFDEITSSSSDPIEIQKRLFQLKSKKYDKFISISYIDYNSGYEYKDDGITITDVREKQYYKQLINQRQEKKALQLYTDEIEDNIYGICKEPDVFGKDGLTCGCFIGRVSINYIQNFLNKLKGKNLKSDIGFPIVLNTSLKFICSPEKEITSKYNFDSWKPSDNILNYVKNPYEKNKEGVKEIINGDCFINNKKYSIVAGLFSKTNWTLCVVTPYKTFDKSANQTMIWIVIFVLLAVILSNIIIVQIFKFEFKPLGELNQKFKEIAAGEADLTKRIEIKQRKTEIGDIQNSFNEYLLQLQNMIKDVAKSKNELIETYTNLASVINKLKKEHKKLNEIIEILNNTNDKDMFKHSLKKLNLLSSNFDFLIPELENILKKTYTPVGKLSSSVDGFKY